MNKSRYTRKQNDEIKFHDSWSYSVEVNKIRVEKYFSANAACDYRGALDLLGNIKEKTVLDLGCGLGESSVYLALKGARVKALDLSFGMLKCAKSLAKRYHCLEKIQFIQGPAEKILLKSNSVDFVFGGNILHHVDIGKTSKEIKRVLKKGGKAVFIEPLGYNPIIQIYRFLATDVRTKMERPFTFKDIEHLGCGFKTVKHQERQLFTTLVFVWFFIGERIDPKKVRYWKRIIDKSEKYEKIFNFLKKIDNIVLKFPLLRYWCWNTIIELVK